jgi:hypothetical protein
MDKKPLYRKVNTTARGVLHLHGGDFRDSRKASTSDALESKRAAMNGRKQRGLDYTPLFKFLLSKVGLPWNAIHSEALSRLDRGEPIFWIVAIRGEEKKEYLRVGEASYYSGLYVDDEGRLQLVNPNLGPESLAPQCQCCTHTFNGIRFTRKYDPSMTLSAW